MDELTESIMKIACKLSVNILDDVNMTIDEQKTKAVVAKCVDRESFNLGLSCAMEIVEMYKKEAKKKDSWRREKRVNVIDEWLDSEGAKRDGLKFKSACDSLDSLRYCAFIQGRNCGKTALAKELARQMLNSAYGLTSADSWAERYLCTVDKVYDTLGIKDYLNKIYGEPMTAKRSVSLKELAKECNTYGLTSNWLENIIKKEEKNEMADKKAVYTLTTIDYKGNRYEITLEKDFKNDEYPYHARVYTIKDDAGKCFTSTFGYRYWEQLETQLMYDLAGNGIVISKDCRDEVTHELHRAKNVFRGCSYANFESPVDIKVSDCQGGYTVHTITPEIMEFKNGKELTLRKAKPFEVMPKIEKVIFNPPATIVQWKDGTKTVVKCQDDDEFDWEKGLAMAYVKRAFNNERTYYGMFKKNEPSIKERGFQALYDPMVAKEVRIIVPRDLPITSDIIQKAYDLIKKECDKKAENGIELEQ